MAENAGFREAEPDQMRFARLETKAAQRPKFGASPVSEVRAVLTNPFETWEKSSAQRAVIRVRYRMMAERRGLASNLLHAKFYQFARLGTFLL